MSLEGIKYPQEAKRVQDKKGWENQLLILDQAFEHVRDFACAIDGGAYAGAWARKMAEVFTEVHAFEPVQDSFECLQKNVGANVKVYLEALSDVNEPVQIAMKQLNWATVSKHPQTDWRGVGRVQPRFVDGRTIDSLNLSPGLIKLDVEGHEVPVLNGARETLERAAPVLIIEYKYNKPGIDAAMKNAGYRMVHERKPDTIWIR